MCFTINFYCIRAQSLKPLLFSSQDSVCEDKKKHILKPDAELSWLLEPLPHSQLDTTFQLDIVFINTQFSPSIPVNTGQMSVKCYRRWFRQKKWLLCNCCDFNPLVVIIIGKETAYTVLFLIKPIFSTLLRKFNFFDDIENNLLKTVRYFHWLSNCCGLHWCPVVSSTC